MRQPVESRADALGSRRKHGDVLTAISDGIVALLKEFYGRGPTRTKTQYVDDLVVCLLRGGFSRVEQTLLEGGRGSSVIQQRMDFQELMRERFQTVIEDATGRRVIGFMSGNQQDPDIMCEVFILAPSDLVEPDELDRMAKPSDATPDARRAHGSEEHPNPDGPADSPRVSLSDGTVRATPDAIHTPGPSTPVAASPPG
jgi:uncharacterized protein YbcI